MKWDVVSKYKTKKIIIRLKISKFTINKLIEVIEKINLKMAFKLIVRSIRIHLEMILILYMVFKLLIPLEKTIILASRYLDIITVFIMERFTKHNKTDSKVIKSNTNEVSTDIAPIVNLIRVINSELYTLVTIWISVIIINGEFVELQNIIEPILDSKLETISNSDIDQPIHKEME